MERSFIIAKDSKYYENTQKHNERAEQQRIFVSKFLKEKGIEANEYYVGGNGGVNESFPERYKNEITLRIIPTEKDLITFGKMLTKPISEGLQAFRKNSSIAKEFAQRCIDEKVIINLHSPKPRDYFKKLGWTGYSYSQFTYNDVMYIKIESNYLQEDDNPEGFTEIKLSEFYKALEDFESGKEVK